MEKFGEAERMERETILGLERYREEEMPYELWLCSFPNIGNRQMRKLVELCGSAEAVYYAGMDRWRQVLTEEQAQKLKGFTEAWRPKQEYERLAAENIGLVTLADSCYPERLRQIPDAPYGLFYRGILPGEEPAVAVVGARDCSQYGSFVAKRLGELLGRNGITVVSGLARGVDGISQRAALEAGGRSWGVLGCGVDVCYPKQNRELYEKLPGQGCLLSSYPPGTQALARNFPPRNRIVSGLADAVVVVEAREKSGTLITVDMALDQGREVYAVPGRITDRLSDGCNRLIRQGASPLLNPEELVEALGQVPRRGVQTKPAAPGARQGRRSRENAESGERAERPGLPPELAAVYQALDLCPRSVAQIREGLPERFREISLSACLIRLCVEGMAVQISPGHFCVGGTGPE